MALDIGDEVVRWLGGTIPMRLKITAITDDRIVCGPWEFDRVTGAEIDDELDWGPPPKMTGSYLDRVAALAEPVA